MSNVLVKDTLVTVLDPGTPAIPGDPGSPGSPAWDEVVDYDAVVIVYWIVDWKDTSNNEHTSLVPPDSMPPAGSTILSETPVFGTQHFHKVIHHDAIPPVPPTPGQAGTPPVVSTNYQLGWNASADSIGTIVSSGEFQFSINANVVGAFVGLNHTPVVDNYESAHYALYFTNGTVQVYESNDSMSSPVAFADSDVFTIRRLGPEVAYYQGSTLLYRSLVASSNGNLSAVAVMYSGGDTITDASITQSVDTSFSATTAGTAAIDVPALSARGSELDGLVQIVVPVPVVAASNDGAGSVSVPVPTVQAHSADAAAMFTTVPVPTVQGEQSALIPVFGIGQAVVPYISVNAIAGQNPGAEIDVPIPYVWSSELDGRALFDVPTPEVFGFDAIGFNAIFATAPRPRFALDFEVLPDYFDQGIRVTVQKPTALLYGGAKVAATAKKPTASLTVFSDYNVIAATVTAPTAAVTALAGCVADIAATAKLPTALAYSGTFISATSPKPTAALVGQSGTVTSIGATAPEPNAASSMSAGWLATVSATAPHPESAGWNFISATAPRPQALAVNDASYTVTDAYAVTLSNTDSPVTRYTNYPFHSIVRLGNDYLGFGPSGVRKLTGTSDAGTAIAWNVQFGSADSADGEQGFKKTNRGCYFDGRFTGTSTLSVSVDDGPTYTYSKLMPTNKRDTLRIVPGRGLIGFAWQFGLSGSGPMDLYRCEFLQRALERKVKHG